MPILSNLILRRLKRLLRCFIQQQVRQIYILGDLFNSPVPGTAILKEVAFWLRRACAANIEVYVLEGSHDTSAGQPSHIEVFAACGLLTRLEPGWNPQCGNVSVFAVPGMRGGTEIANVKVPKSRRPKNEPSLFLYHTALKEALPKNLQDKVPGFALADLPDGFGAYCGGHLHWPYYLKAGDDQFVMSPGPVLGSSVADLLAGTTEEATVLTWSNVGHWTRERIKGVYDGLTKVDTEPIDVTPRKGEDDIDAAARIKDDIRSFLDPTESDRVMILNFKGKWPLPHFNPYPFQVVVAPSLKAVVSEVSKVVCVQKKIETHTIRGTDNLDDRLAQLGDGSVKSNQVLALYHEMAIAPEADEPKTQFVQGRVRAGCAALGVPEE